MDFYNYSDYQLSTEMIIYILMAIAAFIIIRLCDESDKRDKKIKQEFDEIKTLLKKAEKDNSV